MFQCNPMPIDWAWIPITVFAALAQTLRNATQRKLVGELGTLGATLVRFVYGAPFAALWLALVCGVTRTTPSGVGVAFIFWVTLGAASQIVATAALLRTMQARSFALGVAYSKTEILLVALFGLVFLGDALGVLALAAVLLGTLGVLLLAPADPERPLRALLAGWSTPAAQWGLASGACFALAAVAFRGATLQVHGATPVLAAASTLLVAQLLQTLMLGGYLMAREPTVVRNVRTLWRPSLFAGFMGAAASAGWFTALALSTAAHVRTLGLVELVFSYAISLKLFRERFTRRELLGMLLLAAGLVLVTLRA